MKLDLTEMQTWDTTEAAWIQPNDTDDVEVLRTRGVCVAIAPCEFFGLQVINGQTCLALDMDENADDAEYIGHIVRELIDRGHSIVMKLEDTVLGRALTLRFASVRQKELVFDPIRRAWNRMQEASSRAA